MTRLGARLSEARAARPDPQAHSVQEATACCHGQAFEDVLEYGRALGLALSQAEARSMQSRMAQHIASFESFHELRIEEEQLPLTATDRDPGYRPTEKDHISAAGIPLSLGSHFMDGYIPDFDASIVTRLLAAGGTIVGKMNMEDFSFPG